MMAACSRGSRPDFSRFIEIATGSLFEVVSQATVSRRQGLLNDDEHERIYAAAKKTEPNAQWAAEIVGS
jgi:four helix bundle protein